MKNKIYRKFAVSALAAVLIFALSSTIYGYWTDRVDTEIIFSVLRPITITVEGTGDKEAEGILGEDLDPEGADLPDTLGESEEAPDLFDGVSGEEGGSTISEEDGGTSDGADGGGEADESGDLGESGESGECDNDVGDPDDDSAPEGDDLPDDEQREGENSD